MDLNKAYYRSFQAVFNVGARCLTWRRPITVTGAGCAGRIPELLRRCGVKKVLVVSGPLTGALLVPPILKTLDENNIAYVHFDQVEANPSVATAETIRRRYLDNHCEGFVAVGGGSPMDAAKAAAARVACPRKDMFHMAGMLRVGKKLPPLIAVPTTAGTGSETTIASILTDRDTHHKFALMDLQLIPLYAVLDPALSKSLSPFYTATTGMDALTHAVEAYLCWTYNTEESLRLAEEATVEIFKWLEKAYRNGDDLEARNAMLIASFKAGFAFTRAGVGNVHAIAHTLGGLYDTPHGLANAVILPIVLEDYGPAVHKKLARLAELTGVATNGTEAEKAAAFIAEIRAMNSRMDIPATFDHIKEQDVPQMARWALAEANPIYPVPVVYDTARCTAVIHRVMGK